MILPLEQQVCSLELAIQLRDLGVKQESLFYWEVLFPCIASVRYYPYAVYEGNSKIKLYSAFTVAELGELLPKSIRVIDERDDITYELSYDENGYPRYIYFRCCDYDLIKIPSYEEGITEADARALMRIWLIENGYVKP